MRGWVKTQTRCVNCPPQVRVRARRGEEIDTVRDLPTAGVLGAGAGFLPARENRSSAWACTRNQPRACETWGRNRHGARLAHRRRGLSPRPGKQEPGVGPHPEPAACVRDAGKKKTGCASCSAQPRLKSQGAKLSFSSVSVRWGRAGAFARRVSSRPQGTGGGLSPRPGKQKPGASMHSERTAGVRDAAKKKTGCATCPAQPRGRARLGKDTNPVRELPTAGARLKCRHKPGARLAHRRCAVGNQRNCSVRDADSTRQASPPCSSGQRSRKTCVSARSGCTTSSIAPGKPNVPRLSSASWPV